MTKTLRERLAEPDARLTLTFLTTGSPLVALAAAAAGLDAAMIDMEHGAIDHADAQALAAALSGHRTAPIIRIAENTDAAVKRALDVGAEGICFPLIRDAADARWAVAALRYPPEGTRPLGPFLAPFQFGQSVPDYIAGFNRRVVCMLLAETREAVENIEEIAAVPGVDLIVPARFDLSAAYGVPGQTDHPDVQAATDRIEAACTAAGLPLSGVVRTAADAAALWRRGYRMIATIDAFGLRQMFEQLQGWTRDA